MKLIKMLGLAAIAAVAAMAFLGAGTASATNLCFGENAEVVKEAIVCKAGQTITLLLIVGKSLGSKPVLKVGTGEFVECEGVDSLFHYKSGTSPNLTMGSLTWLGPCTSTVSACKGAATVETPSTTLTGNVEYVAKKYTAASQGEAVVTLNTPETIVKLTCFGIPVTCKYAATENVSGTALNSTHHLTVNKTLNVSGGFGCPKGTEEALSGLAMDTPTMEGETGKAGDLFWVAS